MPEHPILIIRRCRSTLRGGDRVEYIGWMTNVELATGTQKVGRRLSTPTERPFIAINEANPGRSLSPALRSRPGVFSYCAVHSAATPTGTVTLCYRRLVWPGPAAMASRTRCRCREAVANVQGGRRHSVRWACQTPRGRRTRATQLHR